VALLDALMAEGHSQRDMLWQPGREGGGRERMATGISAYRSHYPCLRFRVLAVMPDAAAQRCAVEWSACGAPETDASSADDCSLEEEGSFCGVTVLQFHGGQIVESRVYRQAPPAEMHHHMYRMLRGEQRG
jgi:hypothetical protein